MEETEKVTVGSFQAVIGANIRRIRKIRGYTLNDLAEKYYQVTGALISAVTIGAWERGEKNLTASQLHYLSKALQCTEQTLYAEEGIEQWPGFDRYIHEAQILPEAEQQALIFAATGWNGNRHALVQFAQLYMSLDKNYRADIAGMGIMMYKKAKAEGKLETLNLPPIDIDFIEDEWFRLLKE